MNIPTVDDAIRMLNEAEKMNPGQWVEHSKVVASTAKLIAEKCNNLDENTAYILDLLHDIGRREGWKHVAHIMDGYNYLNTVGYSDAAIICLTHSFPINNFNTYHGLYDCLPEDIDFLENFILNREYNDYDKLIQLCDAISLPHGVVLMEKRLVDVVMRHGLPEWTLDKWNAFFELKRYFDTLAKCNIYTLIPNITNNTFEW